VSIAPDRRQICVVVCQNGLGHFRRTMAVIDTLLRTQPDLLRVDILCEPWQLSTTSHWPVTARLRGSAWVRFHTAGLDGSPRWGSGGEDDRAYFAWIENLKTEVAVRDADLVISDNLVGVLAIRNDALLMGSFLWHEVIRGRGCAADRIAAWDQALVAAIRPPMLCVREIATAEVYRLTRAVPLPWFCESAADARRRRWPIRNVLLLGGATSAATPALRALASVLHDHGDFVISAPERLLAPELRGSVRVSVFDFSEASFAGCDLAIGRPGVGMLTDCVQFGFPLLCFGDEPNAEMRHNALRVEELGVGRRIWLADGPAPAARLLHGEITRSDYLGWCRNLAARPTGGIAEAARYISRILQLE
jgi:hypothetical protein